MSIANSAALRQRLAAEGPAATFLVPLQRGMHVGDRIELEIVLEAADVVVRTRGIVRWRRTRAHAKLPAGMGVELDALEMRVRSLLQRLAEGETVPLVRRGARRFAVALAVEIHHGTRVWHGVTRDISASGCALEVDHALTMGTLLRIIFPGFQGTDTVLHAEVVWSTSGSTCALGVKFVQANRQAKHDLQTLLADVQAQVERPS